MTKLIVDKSNLLMNKCRSNDHLPKINNYYRFTYSFKTDILGRIEAAFVRRLLDAVTTHYLITPNLFRD